MSIKYLTPELWLELCMEYAQKQYKYDEPIPDITEEGFFAIKGCLENIRFEYYPTFEDKGAMLFYSICSAQHLTNGNKRLAIVTLSTFLTINKKSLDCPQEILHIFAVGIGALSQHSSSSSRHEVAKKATKELLKRFVKDIKIT